MPIYNAYIHAYVFLYNYVSVILCASVIQKVKTLYLYALLQKHHLRTLFAVASLAAIPFHINDFTFLLKHVNTVSKINETMHM